MFHPTIDLATLVFSTTGHPQAGAMSPQEEQLLWLAIAHSNNPIPSKFTVT
jgi:hypothetical protein